MCTTISVTVFLLEYNIPVLFTPVWKKHLRLLCCCFTHSCVLSFSTTSTCLCTSTRAAQVTVTPCWSVWTSGRSTTSSLRRRAASRSYSARAHRTHSTWSSSGWAYVQSVGSALNLHWKIIQKSSFNYLVIKKIFVYCHRGHHMLPWCLSTLCMPLSVLSLFVYVCVCVCVCISPPGIWRWWVDESAVILFEHLLTSWLTGCCVSVCMCVCVWVRSSCELITNSTNPSPLLCMWSRCSHCSDWSASIWFLLFKPFYEKKNCHVRCK